jgi:hypothetical protein
MGLENNQRWRELCALAAKETDQEKFMKLVEEINRLLEGRESKADAGNGNLSEG